MADRIAAEGPDTSKPARLQRGHRLAAPFAPSGLAAPITIGER
jgi:hypothetical protein